MYSCLGERYDECHGRLEEREGILHTSGIARVRETILFDPATVLCDTYAQVAYDTNSLFLGIPMGVIMSIALTGLFECVRTLEDPFFLYLPLDGINV